MIRTLVIGSLLFLNRPLRASAVELPQGELAQSQSESTSEPKDEIPADLRILQIESARAEKEGNLRPETEPELQYKIKWVQSSVPYKLMTSQHSGFGIGFGRVVSGAGFAIGPQFSGDDFLNGRLALQVGGRVTTNRSYLGVLGLSFHDLLGGRAFVNFGADHRNFSEVPYYGPGPDSEKSGRSDYRLEDTTLELRPGITPFRHVSTGVIGAYSKVNVGPGHSTRYVSTEREYGPEFTPGMTKILGTTECFKRLRAES
jgi:hypothetical protein